MLSSQTKNLLSSKSKLTPFFILGYFQNDSKVSLKSFKTSFGTDFKSLNKFTQNHIPSTSNQSLSKTVGQISSVVHVLETFSKFSQSIIIKSFLLSSWCCLKISEELLLVMA
jgi:hypothetical protein